jgi:hypothetical protein
MLWPTTPSGNSSESVHKIYMQSSKVCLGSFLNQQELLNSFRRSWTPFSGLDYCVQHLPVFTPTKTTTRVVRIPSLADNAHRIPVRSLRFIIARC